MESYSLADVAALYTSRWAKLLLRGWDPIDGDTIVFLAQLDDGLFDLKTCRVDGTNTPEISKPRERKAAELVTHVVTHWIDAIPGSQLRVKNIGRDKFSGRFLGDLFDCRFPENTLSKFLLVNKLGKSYSGERKPEWSDDELNAVLKSARKQLNQFPPINSRSETFDQIDRFRNRWMDEVA